MTKDIVIGQRLHDVMEIWKQGMREGLHGILLQGKAINMLKKDKLWIKDCAGIPSFKYYVEHELHISVAQAHRLDEIYRETKDIYERLDIQGVELNISTITLLLPYLHGKTEDEKIELLMDNSNIPLQDVKNNILEMQGKGDMATDICEHEEKELFWRCPKCGKFFKAGVYMDS